MATINFNTKTLLLAKQLLGHELIHHTPEGTCAGIIVETEAYLFDDKACHAYFRRTPANEAMFHEAGTVYVYNIYGMYQCFNIVSNKMDVGEAVLIRALEPTQGIALMQERRLQKSKTQKHFAIKDLCSGPSKLCQAMHFKKEHSFLQINQSAIELGEKRHRKFEIVQSTRIGINADRDAHLPYRFYIKDNMHVSKK